MKTIFLNVILLALSLGTAPSVASTNVAISPVHAAWQESLRDDETLKACLRERLWGENDVMYEGWTPWDLAIWFRDEAGDLPDERLHAALTDIYRDAEAQEGKEARELMTRAALWLGVCSDKATKAFLLDVATDASKDGFLRTTAFSSYFRNADAEETRDALLKFLVGDSRDINRLSVYSHALEVYNKTAAEDVSKRRAIITALTVAAAREEGKVGFVEVDRILAMRSDAYRRSRERLALLERHSLEPPTQNLYTDSDLKAALAEARKFKTYTSVNTNAVLLKAHEFGQDLTADATETWGGQLIVPDPEAEFAPRVIQSDAPAARSRSVWHWAAGASALAVVAAGIWQLRQRRKLKGK